MLKEPSGLRSQPSNAGTTSCPLAYRVWARAGVIAVRKTRAKTSAASAAVRSALTLDLSRTLLKTAKDQGRRSKGEHLLVLILTRPICLQAIAFGDLRLELVVAHV